MQRGMSKNEEELHKKLAIKSFPRKIAIFKIIGEKLAQICFSPRESRVNFQWLRLIDFINEASRLGEQSLVVDAFRS